jgi:hypothetical protein
MPTPRVPDAKLQQALDWVETHGTGYRAIQALGPLGVADNTIDRRAELARLKGMRPTVRKDAPRIYSRERLGKMHIVIPDCQVRPGVNTDHLEHIGNFVAEKKPDELICIGDFADFPSLSVFDKGTLKGEGRRYNKDVQAANAAMYRLMLPIVHEMERSPWPLRKTFTLGNHEERALRFVNLQPEMEGTISLEDLNYKACGWEVHPFLQVVKIDGIEYCHYFTSGVRGLPVSSAAALLRERQGSATMGHVQHTDIAMHKKTQKIAMFCGTAYTHDEDYLGPQGNCQRRQIIVKHEVDGEGHYDPMLVSLAFLGKAYS